MKHTYLDFALDFALDFGLWFEFLSLAIRGVLRTTLLASASDQYSLLYI